MRNRTYGGVRGRKTKVGRKLLRFPPTQFHMFMIGQRLFKFFLFNFQIDSVVAFCSGVKYECNQRNQGIEIFQS